jgi:hypothetical protein
MSKTELRRSQAQHRPGPLKKKNQTHLDKITQNSDLVAICFLIFNKLSSDSVR